MTSPGLRLGSVIVRRTPVHGSSGDFELVLGMIGLAGAALIWILPLDQLAPFAGVCHLKLLTGVPCATCGTTRALLALHHGKLLTAFRLNPLMSTLVVGGILYAVPALWQWWRRSPRWRVSLTGPRGIKQLVAVGLGILVLNWAYLVWDGR